MIRINKKALAASLTAVVVGMGTGVAFAAGDTDDNISPASTNFTATNSTNVVFKGSINVPITITCKSSSVSGTMPSSGLAPVNISNPSFTNCTATVTTNSTNGPWQLTFTDSTATDEETQTEPNSGDSLKITIPKADVTITSSAFPNCVITVGGPITGSYDDVNTLSFSNVSIPVQGSGCTVTATMTGAYKFTPGLQDVS